MFFAPSGWTSRTLPILIEIKPYHVALGAKSIDLADISYSMLGAKVQIQEQAQFAFDEYKDLDNIHVVLVVGFHWDIKEFKRSEIEVLPDMKTASKRPAISAFLANVRSGNVLQQDRFNPRPLWNVAQTDFHQDFKKEWARMMRNVDRGLKTNWN